MNNIKKFTYWINLCFFAYFIILIAERAISLSLSFLNSFDIFSNFFNGAVYITIFVSIIGFFIYLFIFCRKNIKALSPKYAENLDFKHLIIASGILLISGMVHSEYTISPLQFTSYGFFIIAIILWVIDNRNKVSNKKLFYISTIYLIAYSMAIPVTYESHADLSLLYHIVSLITSYGLVAIFTFMTLEIFKNKSNIFSYIFIVIAIILDTFLIIFRWNEEINFFVLIFISLSTIILIIGRVVAYLETNKSNS